MYKLTLDLPNLAKGTEVTIDGLGNFENGYTYEITPEGAEAFRVRHEVVTTRTDKKGKMTTTVKPGPTLLQFFQRADGIEVETYDIPKPSDPPPPPDEPDDDERGDDE